MTRPHVRRTTVVSKVNELTAAWYVRASTSHQQYSIENQQSVIAEYARTHEIRIVRTYSDPARSGLFFRRRTGLQRLITDVQAGQTDFNTILVYDVSRWGRFQDTDESAYYEFICKRAGVAVRYCSELFENTGGLFDNLLKHMKRTMAAEYSRDLSARISRGHQNLAKLGLHQGGVANYGLRRMLVDESGELIGGLASGQWKTRSTDRVILAPGSPHEVETIREIFRLFVEERHSQRGVAQILNQRGVLTSNGCGWSGEGVYRILTCEKYIGTFVYRQSSYQMSGKRIWQPQDQWIRVPSAIKPIVDVDTFNAAKHLIWNAARYDRNHLLDCLTAALCSKGYVSAKSIDKSPFMPAVHSYYIQFGSLSNAYRLIGYRTRLRYRHTMVAPTLRALDREVAVRVVVAIESHGGRISFNDASQLWSIDGNFAVAVRLLPYVAWKTFSGWKLSLGHLRACNAVLVGRLNTENKAVQDYFLFPRDWFKYPSFHFTIQNTSRFRSYKLRDLADLYGRYLQYRVRLRS